MDSTISTIGNNIRAQRERRNLTQEKLAEKITELSGRNVPVSTVSKWEHGTCEIGISMLPYICKALRCSSYVLYPESTMYSDLDMRLLHAIRTLPERVKRILDYILHGWAGDDIAFWELCLLYASLARHRRQYIAMAGLDEFTDAMKTEPDAISTESGLGVDVKLIRSAARALDNEEE